MSKKKPIYLPANEAIDAVAPENLIDVLVSLQEEGMIDKFEIFGGLIRIETRLQDCFDISRLTTSDFSDEKPCSLSRKPS